MGVWITIAIVLFVLGSMMALKPNGVDQRLDKLRMTARCLQMNPKLVACPDWVRGKNNEHGRGMIGQYGLVLDNVQMPHTRYQVIDGQWRPDSDSANTNATANMTKSPASFNLDKVPLALPASIEPFVKALLIKANSIVIYWEDIDYVRPLTNPNYKSSIIEPDLLALKAQMEQWALQMQASPRSTVNLNGGIALSKMLNQEI
ncbi:hypothetical protein RCH20_000019 [Psychrobacter sp. PL15]|jgi:hypothetical protein|uniref:hypothetical protein n=1 Tax=unclassified Psychrobacter TaxID=196806 RepID=UPI001AE0ECE2|nr:hypothetical protein [Psychrobacter sp. PL15]MEC5208977.1 hypothetical protein [Psychrobacter sp. PL15]